MRVTDRPSAPDSLAPRSLQLPTLGSAAGAGQGSLTTTRGTASFSLPLVLPQARELTPNLDLEYSSSGGFGIFGLGFALTSEWITRATDFGMPRYSDDDVFVYSDHLVLSDEASVTFDAVTYVVRTYRQRVVSQYERIEHWRSEDSDFWRVTSADNVTSVYGGDAGSRIADPDNAQRIYRWLLEYQYDAKGNAVRYQYAEEDTIDVADTLTEKNRSHTANRYLRSISYGNSLPFDSTTWLAPNLELGWCFEIVFDYGEYDIAPSNDDPYTPVGQWKARKDPTSDYSPGFEVRTHRLCRNILTFHSFAELGTQPVLTRAVTLTYDESPMMTLLTSLRTTGYRYHAARASGQRYSTKQTPAQTFDYQPFHPKSVTIRPLLQTDGSDLPIFEGASQYALVDIAGRGVPDIFYTQGSAVDIWQATTGGSSVDLRYAKQTSFLLPLEHDLSRSDLQLLDVGGTGQLALMVRANGRMGYYAAQPDGSWSSFVALPSAPTDLEAPWEVADLNGTGLGDLICIERGTTRYRQSLGFQGYADEELRFTDGLSESLSDSNDDLSTFATVAGCGATQRVRLRNGTLECWPSLGGGRFGEPVVLANVPRFVEGLDAPRVHFADVNGSGLSDLVYCYGDHVDIYLNQSGNGFAKEPICVPLPNPLRSQDQIYFADINGVGSHSMVFVNVGGGDSHLWFDFTAGNKPYLLNAFDNGSGARSSIVYKSSVQFQLEDLRDGIPWLTTVPFPLQLVESLTHEDLISQTRMTSTYRYHHARYDATARQFRGFGMIEQCDTPKSDELSVSAGSSCGVPCLTKSWYHTGAWIEEDALLARLETEYFSGDAEALASFTQAFSFLESPASSVLHQAHEALAGMLLREEVYGLDGSPVSDVPYSVSAHAYTVKQLTAVDSSGYAAFTVVPQQAIEYRYERDPSDPVTSHVFVLAVDEFSEIVREATVTYPRRPSEAVLSEQEILHIRCDDRRYFTAQQTTDVYLHGLLEEERTYELTGIAPPDVSGSYYSWHFLDEEIAAAFLGPVTPARAHLLMANRYRYVTSSDSQTVAPQGLLSDCQSAFVTGADIANVFTNVPLDIATRLSDAGYQLDASAGLWWKPGSVQTYHGAQGFYQPETLSDAFAAAGGVRGGAIVTYSYDAYYLGLIAVSKAASVNDVQTNHTRVLNFDYIALQPQCITDINDVTLEVAFDPFGSPVAMTHYGSEFVNGQPERVGFASLDSLTLWEPTTLEECVQGVEQLLGPAASAYFFDALSWERGDGPAGAVTVCATSYPRAVLEQTPPQVIVSFFDGLGRQVQQSRRADPGAGIASDAGGSATITAQGAPLARWLDTRWLVSGRIVYNDKADPYRQYDPFYTGQYRFIPLQELPWLGSPIAWHYDALSRVARTSYPRDQFAEAFFATTTYAAWTRTHADQDDTVLESDYYRYHVTEGHPLSPYDAEALQHAVRLADTPTTAVIDGLGNTIAHVDRVTASPVYTLTTRTGYDLLGNELWRADPRLDRVGLKTVQTAYAMDGSGLRYISGDYGTRYQLHDVLGNIAFCLDARGYLIEFSYDSFGRLVSTMASGGDGTAPEHNLTKRIVYGDSLDESGETVFSNGGRNTVGQIVRLYDEAMCSSCGSFTILGQQLESSYSFRADYKNEVDWSTPSAQTWSALFSALQDRLEPTTYFASARYDAGQREVSSTGVTGRTTAVTYDLLGKTRSISTKDIQAEQWHDVVRNCQYNAHGQLLEYDCYDEAGSLLLTTTNVYEPNTFRLISQRALRQSDSTLLQDVSYYYDPVGCLTRTLDNAAPNGRLIRNNEVILASNAYAYDGLYRLQTAAGRATVGLNSATQRAGGYDSFFTNANPNDSRNLENYQLAYAYDDGGNLTTIQYGARSTSWTQHLAVDPSSNRGVVSDPLLASPQAPFDGNGNPRWLLGISGLTWSYRDHLQSAVTVNRVADPDASYYQYTESSARVRRVSERFSAAGMRRSDTRYFRDVDITTESAFNVAIEELHRERSVQLEGQCLLETLRWVQGSPPKGLPAVQLRYRLSDALGSAVVELDATAQVISREEYGPYGTTTYVSARSLAEVSHKAYRFSGKERDQDTGLSYFGQRYYAPWMGRWLNADPLGLVDGTNPYQYCSNNPTGFRDPFGCAKRKLAAPPPPPAGTPAADVARKKKRRKRPDWAKKTSKGLTRSIDRTKYASLITFNTGEPDKEAEDHVSADWLNWYKKQKRPPIADSVRKTIYARKAKNQTPYDKAYKKAGVDADLAELRINQCHKLAQSWIRAIVAYVMDQWTGAKSSDKKFHGAIREVINALHGPEGKDAAKEDFDETAKAVRSGDIRVQKRAATALYQSLGGKAKANFRMGSAAFNQILGHAGADLNFDSSGNATPMSGAIQSSVLAPALALPASIASGAVGTSTVTLPGGTSHPASSSTAGVTGPTILAFIAQGIDVPVGASDMDKR